LPNRKGQVLVNGTWMSAKRHAELRDITRGSSKYIKARREVTRRAKQIREMNGPNSMEWVQSALFLYACRKNKLDKDLKKAIWAYTSALIVKLEDFVTNAEKIAERQNIADSFHWVALQLRAAIRNHMKLLQIFKDEEIEVPPVTNVGRDLRNTTHIPSDKDSREAMTYLLTTYRQKNPDAEPVMPPKDII